MNPYTISTFSKRVFSYFGTDNQSQRLVFWFIVLCSILSGGQDSNTMTLPSGNLTTQNSRLTDNPEVYAIKMVHTLRESLVSYPPDHKATRMLFLKNLMELNEKLTDIISIDKATIRELNCYFSYFMHDSIEGNKLYISFLNRVADTREIEHFKRLISRIEDSKSIEEVKLATVGEKDTFEALKSFDEDINIILKSLIEKRYTFFYDRCISKINRDTYKELGVKKASVISFVPEVAPGFIRAMRWAIEGGPIVEHNKNRLVYLMPNMKKLTFLREEAGWTILIEEKVDYSWGL